ncbi:MAG TPA: hypothetical protein VGR31_03125 [Planctomycetota bacterium]|nr:hypothetical protein [Planctomycetota bacterium]
MTSAFARTTICSSVCDWIHTSAGAPTAVAVAVTESASVTRRKLSGTTTVATPPWTRIEPRK